jgi:signal transduction histidine kinase
MQAHTKIVLIFCFWSFCFLSSIAQSEDYDSGLIWFESFFQDVPSESIDKAINYSNSKLQSAKEAHDFPAMVKALNELGLIQITRTNDYDVGMNHLIRALTIEDSLNIKDQQIYTNIAIAYIFEQVGDFYKSKQFLNHAMLANEQSKNTTILVFILNKLGNLNASMGRTEEAFENYEMVLKYKDEVSEPKIEAEALFNLANLYKMQGKYDDALQNHKQALAIRREIKDRRNEAASLNDIGELYRIMKNDEKALANHVVALEIRKAIDDKKGMAQSFNNIGVLYFHQKNYQRAIANLNLGEQAGNEAHDQNELSRSFEYLFQCYKEIGDYKKALEQKELSFAMNELIQNERNERQILETQNRYTIDQRENQIVKLESDRKQRELQIEEQKRIQNFLFIVIALGVVIVLLILYLYITKRRSGKILEAAHAKVQEQNLELQDLNATKDKFFSIISHDLKGPLNSLTSFSGLLINHADSLSKEEIQMLAKDLDKSLKNLFALLENLLEWSRSQTGNIEFKPEVFDLSSVLNENKELLTAQAQNKKIDLVNSVFDKTLVNANKNSVNTVVRNLISNAIKFTPEAGKIELRVQPNGTEVTVSVADNGVGMSQEIMDKLFRIDTKHTTKGTADEKGTGLGLILCKEFIEKNGGRIWVESEIGKGSVFRFSLKKG